MSESLLAPAGEASMAKEHHLNLLKQSVRTWNFTREQRPDVVPDLSAGDLNGAYLVAADLSGANLIGASLVSAN
ncbi:MAG TPA: pentapeptide repeat-containing protein, partial [Bryobacteraceae bacterium]|nr:pentapeptide repeat-containing protein [Bryobacteraceae bacterium]